jgi:hypothetical protein
MKQIQICFVSGTTLVLFLFLLSPVWGQINVGDYTISGGGEIGGLPRGFKGDKARFEEYRDIPESIIVPQLQLMIGGKKRITICMLTLTRLDLTTRAIPSASVDTGFWIWNSSGIKFPTGSTPSSPGPLIARGTECSLFPPSLLQPRQRLTPPPHL